MKGALLAMVLLSTTIKPNEQVGKIEFTVDSVSVNGGVTVVKMTYINRGTLPTNCGSPDIMWKDPQNNWHITGPVDKIYQLGKLQPGVPRKVSYTFNRTGSKLRVYEPGFKRNVRAKEVNLP